MSKGKVLIVDDDKTCLKLADKMLRAAGYETKTAENGEDALEIIKKEYFDVVLTDLVMPEIDGVMLCRHIKKISPKTEVVLISGQYPDLKEQKKNFFAVGGGMVLTKPLLPEELQNTVDELARH